jgi:hypothetical protein
MDEYIASVYSEISRWIAFTQLAILGNIAGIALTIDWLSVS